MTYERGLLPPFAGPPTFARCPRGRLGDLREGMVAVFGVVADTIDERKRPGTAPGAAAIRHASMQFISHIEAAPGRRVRDTMTGNLLSLPDRWDMLDLGDVESNASEPPDIASDLDALTRPVLEAGAIPLMLGGPASLSYLTNVGAYEEDGGLVRLSPTLGAYDEQGRSATIGTMGFALQAWFRQAQEPSVKMLTAEDDSASWSHRYHAAGPADHVRRDRAFGSTRRRDGLRGGAGAGSPRAF
jgi:hypothetical protein